MTDREAMQQALKALEEPHEHIFRHRRLEAIVALKERLAQPETVMAEYKHQTYAAYKTDGEMKIGVLPEPVIDKSAARRIATVLGWVPPGDTSTERVDETSKQRQEQEPTVKWDASAPLIVHPHPAFQSTPPRREWVGLTEEDFSAINQSCLTKLQAATSAESILKGKNNG